MDDILNTLTNLTNNTNLTDIANDTINLINNNITNATNIFDLANITNTTNSSSILNTINTTTNNIINDAFNANSNNEHSYNLFTLLISEVFSKIYSSTPHFILIVILITIVTRVYLAAKERFEELNLFNVDSMNEEEKKLYYFTNKLTFINSKQMRAWEVHANKGKL